MASNNTMVSQFYESYRKRHQIAEGLKEAGTRVFGYFCNYTPEEPVAQRLKSSAACETTLAVTNLHH